MLQVYSLFNSFQSVKQTNYQLFLPVFLCCLLFEQADVQQCIHWQPWLSTIHQEVRTFIGDSMGGYVVFQLYHRQKFIPLVLSTCTVLREHTDGHLISNLYLTI